MPSMTAHIPFNCAAASPGCSLAFLAAVSVVSELMAQVILNVWLAVFDVVVVVFHSLSFVFLTFRQVIDVSRDCNA